MFNRILFPTDFSKEGYNALRYAISLTKFVDGELIVQHVVNNFFGPHSHWASLFDVHGLQKQMDFHVDAEVMTLLPEEAKSRAIIRPLILQGKPAEQICNVAREEMVDLVVMGRMGSTGGVTTMQVVRNTARPVLSVPLDNLDPGAASSVERILVATDFTRESKRVTDYAFEIKRTLLKCPFYFIHAVKAPGALERVLEQVDASLDRSRTWAQNQTQNVTPAEFMADGSVSTLVKLGRTSDCIVDAAEQINASLIIMGAKGYSTGQGYFYGTTVNRVLNNVKCPVLTLQV